MSKSKIEWTNETWNPVTGCTKVSPGCKNCYAETFAERFRGVKGHPFEQGFDLRFWENRLDWPLHWKKPRMVFVNSMSDLFHEKIPDRFIDRVFHTMACAPWHTFQVLTKRPERMAAYFEALVKDEERLHGVVAPAMMTSDPKLALPLKNVWLGVSVETQQFAAERIPLLLDTPAAIRFLSCEPLLGPLNLRGLLFNETVVMDGALVGVALTRIDWIIPGGESGHGARPCELGWIESLVNQGADLDIAVFVKQLGSVYAKEHGFKDKKGGDPSEWPPELMVRQFPGATK